LCLFWPANACPCTADAVEVAGLKEKLKNSVALASMAQKLEERDAQHAKDTQDLRAQTNRLQERVKELEAARRSDKTAADKAHKADLAQARKEWALELEKLKKQSQQEVAAKSKELDKEYQIQAGILAAKLRQLTAKARELDDRAAGEFCRLAFVCRLLCSRPVTFSDFCLLRAQGGSRSSSRGR